MEPIPDVPDASGVPAAGEVDDPNNSQEQASGQSFDALVDDAGPADMIGRSSGTREDVPPAPSPAPAEGHTESSQTHEPQAPASSGQVATPPNDLDEATIVARAQDGDLDAFEWLVSAYQAGIFRLAFRMLGDHAEAEDVVQETFIAAWRNLPTLSAPQAFIPWLYRAATNKSLDLLRGRQRRPVHPVPFDDEGGPDGSPDSAHREGESGGRTRTALGSHVAQDPALHHETEARMQALADLLQTVPAGSRACWLLRDVHEFSYAEIAVIVQLPESTVRGRIARARRLLAEGMQPWR
jgi:RNA polymerase sigma-70 factor (ECF subfamily)